MNIVICVTMWSKHYQFYSAICLYDRGKKRKDSKRLGGGKVGGDVWAGWLKSSCTMPPPQPPQRNTIWGNYHSAMESIGIVLMGSVLLQRVPSCCKDSRPAAKGRPAAKMAVLLQRWPSCCKDGRPAVKGRPAAKGPVLLQRGPFCCKGAHPAAKGASCCKGGVLLQRGPSCCKGGRPAAKGAALLQRGPSCCKGGVLLQRWPSCCKGASCCKGRRPAAKGAVLLQRAPSCCKGRRPAAKGAVLLQRWPSCCKGRRPAAKGAVLLQRWPPCCKGCRPAAKGAVLLQRAPSCCKEQGLLWVGWRRWQKCRRFLSGIHKFGIPHPHGRGLSTSPRHSVCRHHRQMVVGFVKIPREAEADLAADCSHPAVWFST